MFLFFRDEKSENKMKKKRILLFVVNDASFFLSHRLPLARAAANVGYEVHVATPVEGRGEDLVAMEFNFHPLPLSRHKTQLFAELRSFLSLYWLFRTLAPSLVHLVTIKPVLYGGLAARLARVPGVVSAVPGLGYVFLRTGWTAALLRGLVKMVYRLALGHANLRVIFQNPDDQELFIRSRLVPEKKTVLIRGSGVDPEQFAPVPEPGGVPVVVLAGRLLWDKGVGEFVAAARILSQRGVHGRFVLVGATASGNPATVCQEQIEFWQNQGVIEWWGFQNDMVEVLRKAHIACLPSYREGLPKFLIEAAASGRPVVTSDVAGCREVVRQGVNGFLVPARDPEKLADSLHELIEGPELRHAMGARGRMLVVPEMTVETVVQQTLSLYTALAEPPA